MTSSARIRRHAIVLVAALATLAALAGPTTAAVASGGAPLAAKNAPAASNSTTARATRVSAATIASDFGSIYALQVPSLANSGWAACPAPITWSVDAGGLAADVAAEQIESLTWAFAAWSAASGLTFEFNGQTQVTYDDASFSVAPADGSPFRMRHIYLAFVSADASDRLDSTTVGLGSPNKVLSSAKEIVGGIAVFSTQHVVKTAERADRSLYLHELGHVLGLAHAGQDANVMYSMVTDTVALGAGDVNGVQSMTKPCTGEAA